MSAASIKLPPSLSALNALVNRARELEAHDPVAAYWCLLRAVELGQTVGASHGTPALLSIMDVLEELKGLPTLRENDAVTDGAAGQAYMTNLALKVFQGADTEDRAGKATKSTATRFAAANTFFDVLVTFGELDEEVREKQKYAKWKAGDIMKALREGRTPHAGPIGEPAEPALVDPPSTQLADEAAVDAAMAASAPQANGDWDETVEPTLPDAGSEAFPSFDTEVGPIATSQAQTLPPPTVDASHPPADAFSTAVLPSAPPLPPPEPVRSSPVYAPPPAQAPVYAPAPIRAAAPVDAMTVVQAQKHCKFAISALNFVRVDAQPN